MTSAIQARALTASLEDHDATRVFGELLGAGCRVGDVIALCGPLAAGKTTLAQGLARGLDVPQTERVRSPTFALCNEYIGRVPVLHIDLYRMNYAEEAEDLGFRDRVGSEGVAIVEWADRFPEILPLQSLWFRLEHEGDRRRIWVWPDSEHSSASHWAERLPSPGKNMKWQQTTIAPPWERPSSS